MSRKRTNPFVAALIGICLIPASVCLHAWNEYRTIHRTRGLQEAAEIVETIPDLDLVDSSLNGKLVHLTGEALTDEKLRDPIFGIEENGITLRRLVQMYQWDEDESTDDGRTHYSYKKVWREGRIDSNRFERSGFENPQPHFPAWQKTATTVMVGKYELSDALKDQKNDAETVRIDIEALKSAMGGADASQLTAHGNGLYFSQTAADVSSPEIGDLKISFELIPNGPVSLVAKLSDHSFASYRTSNGEPIERLYSGTMTAEQMFDRLRLENSLLAWALRGFGLLLCWIGTLMIFSPAQALFRWIPLVGDIAGGLIFFVSMLFAISLSLVTISISWIAVRPFLGMSLLMVAGLAAYGIYRARRNIHAANRNSGHDEPIMLTDDMMVS